MRLLRISFLIFFSIFANAVTIHIAGTADLQGKIENIPKIATIFHTLQKKDPNTLFVTTGDDLMGRYFHAFEGKAIYSLMSRAGYEYAIFGNHEFDKGTKLLQKAMRYATFKFICSDLSLPATLRKKSIPYLIHTIKGVKIGIFSLMSEDLPVISNAKDVTLLDSNAKVAKKMVKLLHKKGVKVIIALTHIGYKQDVALAKQVKGIDLIFGGHSHHYPKKMGHVGKTLIVNGGEKGKFVVLVSLPIRKNERVDINNASMRYIAVSKDVASDPEIVRLLESFHKKLPQAITVGVTRKAWDLRVDILRKGESDVADMINDLLQRRFKVDIVLNNSGAFRGKTIYPPGNITDVMLQEIDEFRNSAYIIQLEGRWIKQILEHSASLYGKGGWLQVAGIRYKVDLRKTPQKIENQHIVQEGTRICCIEVKKEGKWQPLQERKVYNVLTNAFLAKGGDGYFWFKKYGKKSINTYTSFYSLMLQILHKQKELTPPLPDGRIKVIR